MIKINIKETENIECPSVYYFKNKLITDKYAFINLKQLNKKEKEMVENLINSLP